MAAVRVPQEELIRTLPKYGSKDVAERDDLNEASGLMAAPWTHDFIAHPSRRTVLTCGALLSNSTELPVDHMFSALLKVGLIQDMLCLFSEEQRQFHTLATLGPNVCGHPQIVHGGLTAALMDETFGGVVYMLKHAGVLPEGPAFTVHLEVDYKKPVPAASHVICTAEVDSIEGRKTWVRATVRDQPDGQEYAVGKALFVQPKRHPLDTAADHDSRAAESDTGERAPTESGVARQSSFKRVK